MHITDPILIFAILMLALLIAPLLAERFKLPGIIGLILAGIILGPHGLGILDRGLEVELLGTIGLLYIMFLAGLELDMDQFIKHRNHSILFGALTFSIPLILGSLLGKYILNFSWPASILLASMFSSHTLITYPIASRLGLSKQRAVTTTIGGTLFTDTLALFILAVITSTHQGDSGTVFWIKLFTYVALYITSSFIILPRLGRWFFRNIASDGIVAFTGVLAAVFISAHMARIAGLEPIIGACLAGFILNRLIPENSALMNRIQFVGHSLFIPFLLISVGMLVNLSLLFEGGASAIVAASMVSTAIITKWIAAVSGKFFLGYTRDEGQLIFGLSVNQAAATLAAVLVGYNIGIFEEPVLTGTVIMIITTCVVGSWFTDKYARRVALSEAKKPYSHSDAPHRIMIPLANPNTAEELINLALMLRRKDSHEPLYPLAVARAGEGAEERIAQAEKLLNSAVVRANAADVPVIPVTRATTDVASGITQSLTDLRISIIVAGWKGSASSYSRTFGRILDAVQLKSHQMLFVSKCRHPISTMKRVVLATPPLIEHQPGFKTAVKAAKTLTSQMGASMLTLSTGETTKKLHTILNTSSSPLQIERDELSDWKNILPWVKNNINCETDLLVFMSVRKGRLAWQPLLARIPQMINDNIETLNLVVLYPPEMPWAEESPESALIKTFKITSLLPRKNINLNLDNSGIKETISALISSAFNKKKTIEKLTNTLTEDKATNPMELIPGAVLIHAHIPEVSSSIAFLGVNRKGWNLPNTTVSTKALFILLSSKGAPPEMHLKALAKLIGPINNESDLEKLLDSETLKNLWEDK
ncbi:MAG: PTS transporter subunit EIIA [Elusimicrobia bacterium]|nr:PTS transporter subunit EIIA [Elusimicrobiota bacterium]